jgi:hypothetical protein
VPFGTTTTATNWPTSKPWPVRLLRVLLWFVPHANPDNEPLYPLVRRWALEIDETGKPVREVGLGADSIVLFRAPDRRNRGMWTDSPVTISLHGLEPMEQHAFEDLWQKASKSNT